VLVGEDDDLAYHGSGDDELHLVFNFPLMRVLRLTPAHVRTNQTIRLAALPPGAWPCNTLGNHDSPRMRSRFGDGQHDEALARVHAALVLTLKGTPFLYNGEEIGMEDLELTELGQFRDEMALAQYRTLTEQLGMAPAEALKLAAQATRDRCRTPMQWSTEPNAGFSPAGVATWLPVHPNYAAGISVAAQEGDPNSMLHYYRRLLALRRATPALLSGDYDIVDEEAAGYVAFWRTTVDQKVLVALNFSPEPQAVAVDLGGQRGRVLFSSAGQPAQEGAQVTLAPFEARIIELV
jgi:alpha-glucosidase